MDCQHGSTIEMDSSSVCTECGSLIDKLGDDHRIKTPDTRLPRAQADKYVYVKFMEAHLHAKGQNYQRAYDITDALLTLEPKGRYAADLKTFRRWCDHHITQTTIVKAEVIVDKSHL